MPSAKLLAWVLLDRARRHFWHGPGFRRLADGVSLADVATWPTRQEAETAARALRRVLGIDPVAVPLFVA